MNKSILVENTFFKFRHQLESWKNTDILFLREWLMKAPSFIVNLVHDLGFHEPDYPIERLEVNILDKEFFNEDLIGRLFLLFGFSENMWTQFPVYECIPFDILNRLDFNELVAIAEKNQSNSEMQLGCVRYFAFTEVFNANKKKYKLFSEEYKIMVNEVLDSLLFKSKKIRKVFSSD